MPKDFGSFNDPNTLFGRLRSACADMVIRILTT